MAFHYLARGIITSGDYVLLVRAIGDTMTFLPGGHIEFAEPAKEALKRELMEEASIDGEVGDFVGAAENEWEENGVLNAEINLLFHVETTLTSAVPVISNEPHLEFLWGHKQEIEAYNLYPVALRKLISDERLQNKAFWGSGVQEKLPIEPLLTDRCV